MKERGIIPLIKSKKGQLRKMGEKNPLIVQPSKTEEQHTQYEFVNYS